MRDPRMRLRPRLVLLIALLAGLGGLSYHLRRSADTPLDGGLAVVERFIASSSPVDDGARCTVVNGAGKVRIHDSEDRTARVSVRVRSCAARPRIAAELAHATAVSVQAGRDGVQVLAPRILPPGVLVEVDIALPPGVPIAVDTVSGQTVVDRVGPLVVHSQGGEVELTSPSADFELETSSGRVVVDLRRELRHAGRIRTVNGDVGVRARFHAPAGRSSVSYPLRIEARSRHGRIEGDAGSDSGPLLSIESVDGNIDVQSI